MIGEIETGLTEYAVTCFLCRNSEKVMSHTKAGAELRLKHTRWFTVVSLWACPAHSRDEALDELHKQRGTRGMP